MFPRQRLPPVSGQRNNHGRGQCRGGQRERPGAAEAPPGSGGDFSDGGEEPGGKYLLKRRCRHGTDTPTPSCHPVTPPQPRVGSWGHRVQGLSRLPGPRFREERINEEAINEERLQAPQHRLTTPSRGRDCRSGSGMPRPGVSRPGREVLPIAGILRGRGPAGCAGGSELPRRGDPPRGGQPGAPRGDAAGDEAAGKCFHPVPLRQKLPGPCGNPLPPPLAAPRDAKAQLTH